MKGAPLVAWESDARRVFAVLSKRFGKYGLTLHPEKTRLVPFRRVSSRSGSKREGRPGTFDLLGFTDYWARSYRGQPLGTSRSSLSYTLDRPRPRELCNFDGSEEMSGRPPVDLAGNDTHLALAPQVLLPSMQILFRHGAGHLHMLAVRSCRETPHTWARCSATRAETSA